MRGPIRVDGVNRPIDASSRPFFKREESILGDICIVLLVHLTAFSLCFLVLPSVVEFQSFVTYSYGAKVSLIGRVMS